MDRICCRCQKRKVEHNSRCLYICDYCYDITNSVTLTDEEFTFHVRETAKEFAWLDKCAEKNRIRIAKIKRQEAKKEKRKKRKEKWKNIIARFAKVKVKR